MHEISPSMIDAFIQRWAASGAAERANYQLFLSELCDVLGVPRPDPQAADDARNAYVFEKPVPLPHGTTGRINLYNARLFRAGGETGQRGVGRRPETRFLEETWFLAPPRHRHARDADVGHGDGTRP